MREYFGIGIYYPKDVDNMGTLWRSAHNFGADFLFTIGHRYRRQVSDTTKAYRQVPLYSYSSFEDFQLHLPADSELVFVEQCAGAVLLPKAHHPERGIYILGAEDKGVPLELMKGHRKIAIDIPMCLNVAVAGSIIMFDRQNKFTKVIDSPANRA